MMGRIISGLVAACLMVGVGTAFAWDAEGEKNAQAAIAEFKRADPSMDAFFKNAYGYAIFPEITKGGIGIGGAGGDGTVFEQGAGVGSSEMSQVTVGLQLGGQAYSEIIFFENSRVFREFTSGNFEFGAEASAVAITAGASAQASTTGSSAGASTSSKSATTTGKYQKGLAVFTVAKGGLMYEATIGGQKFSYTPKKK